MFVNFNEWGFVLIFNLIGGIAIGSVLRGLVRGRFACQSLFLLVWGILFGGLPLIAGVVEFEKTPYLLAVQIAVFVGASIVPPFIPDILLDTLNTSAIKSIVGGAICVIISSVTIIGALTDPQDWFIGVTFGGLFGVTGVWLILSGLGKLLRHEDV